MPDESSLNDLVSRWEELRRQGRSVRPEELCAGRPELLDELRRQIDELASMEDFLESPGAPARSAKLPPSRPVLTTPDESPHTAPRPHGPGDAPPGFEILGKLG